MEKTCKACGSSKDVELFGKAAKNKDGRDSRCLECRRTAYAANRAAILGKAKAAYKSKREDKLASKAAHYAANRAAILERRRKAWLEKPDVRASRNKYWENRKKTCYAVLGDACSSCGNSDARVLCIDHVDGDGAAERSSGGSLLKLWNKIISSKDSEKYQLLCWNCNYKKWLHQRVSPVLLKWIKTCPTCLQDKDAGWFKADKKYRDGRYYECRECSRKRDAAVKQLAFLRLGSSRCACGVDDPDMLTVDHVNGDGRLSRNLDGLGVSLYRKLAAGRIDRARFQVLCFNCNILKSVGSAAPTSSPVPSRRHLPNAPPPVQMREFDINIVRLERVLFSDVVKFLDEHHYAGCGRAPTAVYAGILGDEMIAVLKFAPPVRAEVARSLGIEPRQVLELDRMCVLPDCHRKNLLSRLLSKAAKDVSASFPDVSTLVTFADPEAGHDGTVYKAANWKLVGKTSRSYVYIDSDGVEHHKKTVYDAARIRGLKESEYASAMGFRKAYTIPKIKYTYTLKR